MAPTMFDTRAGMAVPGVTAAQMREVDRIAVEETGPGLLQMLEHAGRSLAEVALRMLRGPLEGSSVVVLAGAGGNGAGGICAARHLSVRNVDTTIVYSAPDRLGDGARVQRSLFSHGPGTERILADVANMKPDLIIDALIGYGLSTAPRDGAAALIAWANQQSCPILSLDLPSGMDATSGARPGLSIRPAATVTLALPKTGLARGGAGRLFLADLGIPDEVWRRAGIPIVRPFDRGFVVRIAPHR